MKKTFQTATEAFLCQQDRDDFHQDIQKWSAQTPQTLEQFVDNLKNSLNKGLERTVQKKTDFAQVSVSDQKEFAYALETSAPRAEELTPFAAIDGICARLQINPFPDVTSGKNFAIGPLVAKHPELQGASFHEMGHNLYIHLRYQSKCPESPWFKNVRQCLLEQHSEFPSERMREQKELLKSSYANPQYESEDWADLISTRTDPNGKT